MSTRLFTKASDARPFDLAKECLSPRLREDGGLDKTSLPNSKFFRETAAYSANERFGEPLSKAVSPEIMRKMELAVEWASALVHRITGREFSFIEPLVVPLSNDAGSQRYPFIFLNEKDVKDLEAALPAAEWREQEKRQAVKQQESAKAPVAGQEHGEREVPKFDERRTRDAQEIGLAATIIHELIHGMRGVQIGRASTDAVRLGLRVNAFGGRVSDKRFSAFTEAAAILTEGRYFRHQGLQEERSWQTTLSDIRRDSREFVALQGKPSVTADGSTTTMANRFVTLLSQTGVPVKLLEDGGFEVELSFIRFANCDAAVDTGYKQFYWGMEHLAAEIFCGKVSSVPEAVEQFYEMLVKAEVLAEPRPLFREIKNLAKKDVAAVPDATPADERALGKEYLELFSKLRPNARFDMMVFHAFVRADHTLPADQVAKCRSELISLYKLGTEGLDMTPTTNAA